MMKVFVYKMINFVSMSGLGKSFML